MAFPWFTVGTAAVNAGIGLFNRGNSRKSTCQSK